LKNYCSHYGELATLVGLYGGDSTRPFPENKTMARCLRDAKSKKFDILFELLQSSNARNYDNLKYIADVQAGIHTICTVQAPTWR
jgi:hypothetical protein